MEKKGAVSSDTVPLEVPPGFGPGNEGFADLCLTTWLWHQIAADAHALAVMMER